MRYRTIAVELRGAVAFMALASPQRANRIAAETLRELASACEAIAGEDAIRAVVLSAQGDSFCAGWEAETLAAPAEELAGAFDPIAALPQPVVAAVHGETLSAGLELALACDVRIAANDARFALPETAHGLIPLAGGAARLPRVVGRGHAADLLLTGRSIDAAEALRIGLVSRVAPPDALMAEATAVAERVAERGPIATRYAKEAVWRGLDLTLDQALRYETDLTVLLQTTDDRAEGVQAFIEKRPPNFSGR